MEGISNLLTNHRDTLCGGFPRLWLLSNREMIQLLSSPTSLLALQPFVRKCFKGVQSLEVDGELLPPAKDSNSCETVRQGHREMKLLGIFGSLQEHITFLSLEPDLSASVWLCKFEQQLRTTMAQLMAQCFVSLNQLELYSQSLAGDKVADRTPALLVLDLLNDYPLQCLLVAEEAAWCNIVLQAFQENSTVKLSNIKSYTSKRLKSLGHILRESALSKYTMMCMCVLVQLMKQAQQFSQLMEVNCVPLESSFEWVRLLKYHINSEDQCRKSNDVATCHVDVLNCCLKYDFEYYGPEDWVMVHTSSTDRAILGILFALTSHKCGFLRGPCMSGKKTTAVHLGKALGRHVHLMFCSPNVSSSVVQQMLLGALQTDAWFVLDSVDLLSYGVLSSLGEHLKEIYHFFSGLTGNSRETRNSELKDSCVDWAAFPDSDLHMILAGKSICANQNFECVVIGSNWCSSNVPESLRTATRAIALTAPDCRIIAEVMLTSFGFSDAVALSLRLVSLLSLTKDSLSLPDFIADNQASFLVLLQRIIRAAVSYLQQSLRLDQHSTEDKNSSNFSRPHLKYIQLILEETAIVQGILSVCLPLLYEQKKASWFNATFKETFPISCQFPSFQQHIEEKEKKQPTDSLSEELQ